MAGVNPSFVAPVSIGPNGNWHVNPGSPAIDAGELVSDVYATFQTRYGLNIRKDADGATRPYGGAYDIGPYEFGGTSSTTPVAPTNLRIIP